MTPLKYKNVDCFYIYKFKCWIWIVKHHIISDFETFLTGFDHKHIQNMKQNFVKDLCPVEV